MRLLKTFLGEQKIGLADIGASGGLEPRWQSIKGNLKAFLFEPDERSHSQLVAFDYIEEIFPVGLAGVEGSGSINLCRKPMVSSLLSPRYPFLARFSDAKRFEVVSQQSIRLSTLDQCLQSRGLECDFIKADTQGTELDILRGGKALLEGPVIGLEIEVEFLQLYENQSLFGDVCSYLSENGYEFFDFVNICRWERQQFSLFGQAVFGDGLFLRSPETFAEILNDLPLDMARSKAKKYIAIVSLYDHLDLLPVCVDKFKKFLDETDLISVRNLHHALSRRRRLASTLLAIVNRLFRPFGISLTGFQSS